MNKSLYSELCVKTREIRLVRILPSKATDEIFSQLLTVSLESSPSFEALSYVWGDEKITASIFVDERPFQVTTNLKCALQGLRSSTVAKNMWIDAISIDQNNIKERNEQLHLMREIYSQAEHVSVWFGLESDESNRAMDLLPLFTLPQHFHEFTFATHSSDGRMLDDEELSNRLRPLETIIQNPWWERIWVVQEVALARQVSIYYGQRSCEWNDMARVVHWVEKHLFCCGFQLAHYPRVIDIVDRFNLRTYRQIELCQRFQKLECLALSWSLHHLRFLQASNPRDKIYGVLGLTQGLQLDVDYSLSVEATYERTTRSIISDSRSLEVLGQATLSQKKLKLPSWVPDWSYHNEYATGPTLGADVGQLQHLYSASNGKQASLTYDGANGMIILQGVHFDSVSHTTSPIPSLVETTVGPSTEDFRSFYLEVLNHYQEISIADAAICLTGEGAEDLPDHMWRRLLLDITVDDDPKVFRRTTPKDHERHSNLMKTISGSDFMKPHTFAYLLSIQSNYSNRRIFSTSNHRIGVGPRETREGDLVCILEGGPLPFILREGKHATDSYHPTQHTLVGVTYVHGVMDGEIIRDLDQSKGTVQEFCIG